MPLDYEKDRATMIAQVKAASPYLEEGFNEQAAVLFKLKPGTIVQMRKGERFNLKVAEYIIASAHIVRNRMKLVAP